MFSITGLWMTFGDINQSIWSWGGELLSRLHNFSEKQDSKHSSFSGLLRMSDPKVPNSGVGLFHDTGGILAGKSYVLGRAERTSGYGLPHGVMVSLFTSPGSSCQHCPAIAENGSFKCQKAWTRPYSYCGVRGLNLACEALHWGQMGWD